MSLIFFLQNVAFHLEAFLNHDDPLSNISNSPTYFKRSNYGNNLLIFVFNFKGKLSTFYIIIIQ